MARLEDLAYAPTRWAVVDTQTNAQATAQKAGQAGYEHHITGFSISASAAPAAAVQAEVRDGANVLDRFEIPAGAFSPIIHNYTRPFIGTAGNAVSVVVPALGAGVRCTASIRGFSSKGG